MYRSDLHVCIIILDNFVTTAFVIYWLLCMRLNSWTGKPILITLLHDRTSAVLFVLLFSANFCQLKLNNFIAVVGFYMVLVESAFLLLTFCCLLFFSLCWNEANNSTSDVKGGVPLLSIAHLTGNLSIYKIEGTQAICTTELHRLTLKSLIADLTKIGKLIRICL